MREVACLFLVAIQECCKVPRFILFDAVIFDLEDAVTMSEKEKCSGIIKKLLYRLLI